MSAPDRNEHGACFGACQRNTQPIHELECLSAEQGPSADTRKAILFVVALTVVAVHLWSWLRTIANAKIHITESEHDFETQMHNADIKLMMNAHRADIERILAMQRADVERSEQNRNTDVERLKNALLELLQATEQSRKAEVERSEKYRKTTTDRIEKSRKADIERIEKTLQFAEQSRKAEFDVIMLRKRNKDA